VVPATGAVNLTLAQQGFGSMEPGRECCQDPPRQRFGGCAETFRRL